MARVFSFSFEREIFRLDSPREGPILERAGAALPRWCLVRGAARRDPMETKLLWMIASATAVSLAEAPLTAAKWALVSANFLLRRKRRFIDLVIVVTSVEWFSCLGWEEQTGHFGLIAPILAQP